MFSGKQTYAAGDDSDWVDEDDDIPAFAGGLGQMGSIAVYVDFWVVICWIRADIVVPLHANRTAARYAFACAQRTSFETGQPHGEFGYWVLWSTESWPFSCREVIASAARYRV